MASIFTYDPEPPRVSSPWRLTDPPEAQTRSTPHSGVTPGTIEDYGVTKLDAEPQEGPMEYKLHLLLRPRRTYSSSSTGSVISGSQQRRQQPSNPTSSPEALSTTAPSTHARQRRLEQLTTQLVWRLQQSSPHHASAPNFVVLPKPPEATYTVNEPSRPRNLIAGLEESHGALYEIGVSDDGSLVGLTEDELEESLVNLRAMATSIACTVEIIRRIVVGRCTWRAISNPSESVGRGTTSVSKTDFNCQSGDKLHHEAQLWVAEAFVTPDLGSRSIVSLASKKSQAHVEVEMFNTRREIAQNAPDHASIAQLRVTLTGPSTSGKSSLLGVLSMSTLDNGRGKSRLTLLKHRHEIESGVTSSVAQELLGYTVSEVVNYASEDITSWTSIQAAADNRLVLVSDSAGHPRYRRTTVRGLVGWAPHWTLLCIAADNGESLSTASRGTSSAKDIHGDVGGGIDFVKAHLDLCLKLDKPLAIVITKLDLASKSNLRLTLSKTLSAIKQAGRSPTIIPPEQSRGILDSELKYLPEDRDICAAFHNLSDDFRSIVPIVMTSAVNGIGIRQLHSLLKCLPEPPRPSPHDLTGLALNPEQPASLFHIEDIFGVPASSDSALSKKPFRNVESVVGGYLRFGAVDTGDIVVIGPFPSKVDRNGCLQRADSRCSPDTFGSAGLDTSAADLAQMASQDIVSASVTKGEWYSARIVSIRNLRRPVQTLDAGQVGTLGIVIDPSMQQHLDTPRIRKGMVVAIPSRNMLRTGLTLQAASGFTAFFEDSDINSVTPGSLVVVYIASIRASARIISLSPHDAWDDTEPAWQESNDALDVVGPLGRTQQEEGPLVFGVDGITDVSFELMTCREWIELGSQVLCMPGGGQGLYYGSERGEKGVASLDGFVGKVTEVVD